MRKLRRFMTSAQFNEVYRWTYNHERWDEHIERVRITKVYVQKLVDEHELTHLVDLSCGDGAIARGIDGIRTRVLNDVSQGTSIEHALMKMERPADIFICTETIEHLQAPWLVLERIAEMTKWLVLSTPLDEDAEGPLVIDNGEHYWSFSKQDINDMLTQSGFTPELYAGASSATWTYDYQIWTARTANA